MRLETVVEFDDERVVQHAADVLLVLDYTLLLVLVYETLQHHLHRVEVTVTQTAHQVDLAESADCETLADLVTLQPALGGVLETVEGSPPIEHALTNRDLIVH
jgi:hypothetical protein